MSVETLGWSGCGETNGWQYVSLGTSFSDGATRFDGVFAADKSETQFVPASRDLHANGFALSVSDGDVGDWGVYAVGVTVAKTTRRTRGVVVAVW